MIYAPVKIITLNRYEHFKRCLESLENNAWAKYTEVFVSVDYPIKESHWDGNRKIKEYLKEKEKKNVFHKLYIYIQDENLGPAENSAFLSNIIFKRFDRLVSLEDDTEVAPNFIEYMDKALEYGSHDKNCFCVCGYSRNRREWGECTVYKSIGSSWGRGIYREKYRTMQKDISFQWLDNITYSIKDMSKIYKRQSQPTFHFLVSDYILKSNPVFKKKNGELRSIDLVQVVYMIMNGMYVIYPVKSKVKNWGYDGTGENCTARSDMDPQNQVLDEKDSFQFILPNDKVNKKILKYMRKMGGQYDKKIVFKAYLYYIYYELRRRVRKKRC